jgi:hypothetical protein
MRLSLQRSISNPAILIEPFVGLVGLANETGNDCEVYAEIEV